MNITITVVQNSPEFGQPEKNRAEIARSVLGQSDPSADLIVLPELFASGYQFDSRAEVEDLAEPEDGPTFRFLSDLSDRTGAVIVGGLPIRRSGGVSNGALAVYGKTLLASYDKIHLFDEEREFFLEGVRPLPVVATPFGPLGLMICFDWLFPEALRSLALSGALVVAHPSNWVLPFGPQGMILRSVENRVFTVTANRVGREERGGRAPLTFIGQSQIIGPRGDIIVRAPSDAPALLRARIDPEEARSKKVASRSDFFEQRRPELYLSLLP
ncbi:MAG: carbon-nitrogen hydrolase [Nitrospirae bacterium]|nr:MAG: hypothetical protein D084_Lepto4C00207G0002 [Leptospirillum sp. Group IV 'UBA BS']MCL4485821.1 carbon-nitrogen hydrolase [Nitrospirota bacterium]MCL5285250.1 carbon-nitrogen hydrolase [Nitrospirota bacterium]